MAIPSTPRSAANGGSASLAALFARLDEKFMAMEELSRERAKTVDTILAQMQVQQAQINQLVTDMAVLKTQHASFWKGATVLFGVLSLIGGAIGWTVATLLPMVKHV